MKCPSTSASSTGEVTRYSLGAEGSTRYEADAVCGSASSAIGTTLGSEDASMCSISATGSASTVGSAACPTIADVSSSAASYSACSAASNCSSVSALASSASKASAATVSGSLVVSVTAFC